MQLVYWQLWMCRDCCQNLAGNPFWQRTMSVTCLLPSLPWAPSPEAVTCLSQQAPQSPRHGPPGGVTTPVPGPSTFLIRAHLFSWLFCFKKKKKSFHIHKFEIWSYFLKFYTYKIGQSFKHLEKRLTREAANRRFKEIAHDSPALVKCM